MRCSRALKRMCVSVYYLRAVFVPVCVHVWGGEEGGVSFIGTTPFLFLGNERLNAAGC